jgi:putative transposase
MPWQETCVMDERVKFMAQWLAGEASRSELCERYGISRKTGYKWAQRYAADPEGGLADRPHAPHSVPHKIDEATAEAIVRLRHRRPSWGPNKLRAVLQERVPDQLWPAASTIGDLLRREGLVRPRRRRRSALVQTQPFAPVLAANDTWCMDFKGWVPHRRRPALRSADAERRLQPLSAGLPHHAADR